MNMEVDPKDEVMHERSVIFNENMVWWARKGNNRMSSGYCEGVEEISGCEDS